MAPRKNKSKGKGKKGRKTRVPRLVKGTTQFASLTETYDLGALDANTGTKVAVAGLVGFPVRRLLLAIMDYIVLLKLTLKLSLYMIHIFLGPHLLLALHPFPICIGR